MIVADPPKPTAPLLDAQTLADPRGFEQWWEATRQLAWSHELRLSAILEIGGPLASVRASYVYADLGDPEQWALAAGRGLLSSDVAVRCLATARLGFHEIINAGYKTGKGSVSGGTVAIPILERALTEVENVTERTQLVLEAMFRLYQGLTDAYRQSGKPQKAIGTAAEAIKYAKALGLKGGLQAALQMLATTYFVAGDTERALAEYDALIDTPDVSKPVLDIAWANRALLLLAHGDDDAAMHSLEDSGDDIRVQACRQYILCSSGRGGLEGEVLGGLGGMPLEFVFHTECYRLLLANEGQPSPGDLHKIVQVSQGFRPLIPYATVMRDWFVGLALLRQGHAVSAASHARTTPWQELPKQYHAARGRAIMLWLEIGLHYGSEDLALLTRLTSELHSMFREISNPTTRVCLARCLTLWHPLAAAFLAFSPNSLPEFIQSAASSVWRDARPIMVYGEGVTTRTPFVAKALRDFGYRTEDREGGTEETKLLTVLRRPHAREGERMHVRPIISPALLVYNLIRADDAPDSVWRRSALELARSHGLIPVPQTQNFHSREVSHINSWLEKLLNGEVSPAGFRAEIRGTP
jgi:tetratricopeptide (TPR) repeat protein